MAGQDRQGAMRQNILCRPTKQPLNEMRPRIGPHDQQIPACRQGMLTHLLAYVSRIQKKTIILTATPAGQAPRPVAGLALP